MERSQEESSPGKSKKRKSLPGAQSEDSAVGGSVSGVVVEKLIRAQIEGFCL